MRLADQQFLETQESQSFNRPQTTPTNQKITRKLEPKRTLNQKKPLWKKTKVTKMKPNYAFELENNRSFLAWNPFMFES